MTAWNSFRREALPHFIEVDECAGLYGLVTYHIWRELGYSPERLALGTPIQGPIMHAVLDGVDRDQMMARHKSNHIQFVYAPTREDAEKGLQAKAAAMRELGLEVFICGNR